MPCARDRSVRGLRASPPYASRHVEIAADFAPGADSCLGISIDDLPLSSTGAVKAYQVHGGTGLSGQQADAVAAAVLRDAGVALHRLPVAAARLGGDQVAARRQDQQLAPAVPAPAPAPAAAPARFSSWSCAAGAVPRQPVFYDRGVPSAGMRNMSGGMFRIPVRSELNTENHCAATSDCGTVGVLLHGVTEMYLAMAPGELPGDLAELTFAELRNFGIEPPLNSFLDLADPFVMEDAPKFDWNQVAVAAPAATAEVPVSQNAESVEEFYDALEHAGELRLATSLDACEAEMDFNRKLARAAAGRGPYPSQDDKHWRLGFSELPETMRNLLSTCCAESNLGAAEWGAKLPSEWIRSLRRRSRTPGRPQGVNQHTAVHQEPAAPREAKRKLEQLGGNSPEDEAPDAKVQKRT